MADFCKQCSVQLFGEVFPDLAWGSWDDVDYLNSPRFTPDGKPYWIQALCEGCGNAVVTSDGTCICANCIEKHGVGNPNAITLTGV